jgi:hypothetical protein
MPRLIEGVLSLPDNTPFANGTIYITAKRSEAGGILLGASTQFTTNGAGAYSKMIEAGYYSVSVSVASTTSGTKVRRWIAGDIVVADGEGAVSLTDLLSLGQSPLDPTSVALQQLLADAQSAASAAGQSAEQADGARQEVADNADAAVQAAQGANTAKEAAEAARNTAQEHRSDAEAARDNAEQYRDSAEQYRDNAGQSAQAANTAKEAAEAARNTAQEYRSDAETARDNAEQYRDEAEQHKDSAAGSAGAAQDVLNDLISQKGAPGGVAPLNTSGVIPLQYLEQVTNVYPITLTNNSWFSGGQMQVWEKAEGLFAFECFFFMVAGPTGHHAQMGSLPPDMIPGAGLTFEAQETGVGGIGQRVNFKLRSDGGINAWRQNSSSATGVYFVCGNFSRSQVS